MFGSIAHLRPKSGQEGAVITLMQEWERERHPKVPASVAGYVFKPEKNPDELILVAVFRDRESYFANANDPDQDRWYRKLRNLLVADPTWEDGEIVSSHPRTQEAGR